MQVRLLGPVDIIAHGAPRPVAGRRRRAVLAGLALNSGAVVSADQLIDIGWPEATGPVNANTLQCQVSQPRQIMRDSTAIRAMPPGYLLDLGDEGTDVQVAQRLLREGREARQPAGFDPGGAAVGPVRRGRGAVRPTRTRCRSSRILGIPTRTAPAPG